MYNVSFPNLNLYFNLNPIAFSFGSLNIYWYGVLIAFSIALGLFCLKLRDKKFGIFFDDAEEFVLWCIPIGILFARLYYVIFSWDIYRTNLWSIFEVWNGGIAIYGGIIGAIITCIVFCKIKKIKVFDLLDFVVPFLALGQAIGRWGNLFNREAYGSITDSFFRMEILKANGEYILVHPTFLYESFGLLVIFAILMLIKRKFSGQIIASYFLLYGALRTFIEYLRTDSLMIGTVKVSLVLSLVLMVSSIIFMILKRRNTTKETSDNDLNQQ